MAENGIPQVLTIINQGRCVLISRDVDASFIFLPSFTSSISLQSQYSLSMPIKILFLAEPCSIIDHQTVSLFFFMSKHSTVSNNARCALHIQRNLNVEHSVSQLRVNSDIAVCCFTRAPITSFALCRCHRRRGHVEMACQVAACTLAD